MTQESKDWLKDNIDIWERQQRGDYKHLNDRERTELMAVAKDIDGDDTPLSPHCLDCRIKLIRKVFNAYFIELDNELTKEIISDFNITKPKLIRKATFPKQSKEDKIK